MEKIVNKPLAGTFGWLHVGGTRIVMPEKREELSFRLAQGEVKALVLEDSAAEKSIDVQLARGSCLHLVQLRRAEAAALTCSDIRVRCAEDAQFHWYRLVAGGQETYDNCSVLLEGEGSSFAAELGYRLSGGERYDGNCEAIHMGKRTRSSINAHGVLSERAKKLLRGTIDFRTGCTGSEGSEAEDVLLLDETVQNQSVPVILCAEEDVAGNHAATIGQLDERLCFYLASRGLEMEMICEMLARAKLDTVLHKIPDAALRDRLMREV